jgi:hypothetical protein
MRDGVRRRAFHRVLRRGFQEQRDGRPKACSGPLAAVLPQTERPSCHADTRCCFRDCQVESTPPRIQLRGERAALLAPEFGSTCPQGDRHAGYQKGYITQMSLLFEFSQGAPLQDLAQRQKKPGSPLSRG